MAKPIPDVSELLTTSQACAQLDCSRSTIMRWWKQGKLERVRLGGHTRITARSIRALLNETENVLRPPSAGGS